MTKLGNGPGRDEGTGGGVAGPFERTPTDVGETRVAALLVSVRATGESVQ